MAKTILVADDDRGQLALMRHFLEERGYAVITALDGEEALEKTLAHRPELVVLDVQMPVMDGDETAMHLKSKEETKHIPILFITGLRTEQEVEENREENIFAKPVKLELFLGKIKALIGVNP